MTIEKLSELLIKLDKRKGDNFLGLGIIVYENREVLPIIPLMQSSNLVKLPISGMEGIVDTLLKISIANHPYHDGFHLISTDLVLTQLSVYFATPIVKDVLIKQPYGSRYRTALYGSFLKGVYACGIISDHYGPLIFKNGKIIDPYKGSQ